MLGNPPGKIDRAVIAAREGDTRACAGSVADQIGGFGGPVYAAIESMRGARFVHDQPELAGWQVEIGRRTEDQRAGAIGLQDRQDRRRATGRSVPPRPGPGDLAAHPAVRTERERTRWRLHLVPPTAQR